MAEIKANQKIVLSPAAKQDIRVTLIWSHDKFGPAAADRYQALLIQALRDVQLDPLRPGSRTRPELNESARTYHFASSRTSVSGPYVKVPRHFLLYRIGLAGIEVARILHDSRDLARHLPPNYQA